MAKKQLRGKAGNVAKYITRTRAVKRLQLRLAEFRRLCILKGIHPREPKKKVHGQNKTYYHVKDINFLAHEPLLESFRAISAHERKVKKARARRNAELAKQLAKRTPGYRLDHLVKERYPTFQDALRDLDDALCMVHLFAVLPSSEQHAIPTASIQMSRRLVLEWQALMCRMHALRKGFISVKGFYLQASIHSVNITWLMPHVTSQILPNDVDMRVMQTFLEFYHSLLRFVLYKLYNDLGLNYPPNVRPEKEQISAELADIIQELSGGQRSVEEQVLAIKEADKHEETDKGKEQEPGTGLNVSQEVPKVLKPNQVQLETIDKESPDDASLSPDEKETDEEDEEDDAGDRDEDMYEQAQLDEVLRMRLAEAEAAMHDHVATGGAGANANALEEKFGKEAVAAAGGAVATGHRPPAHLSPFETYDDGDYVPEAAARLKRLQAAAAEVRQAPLLEGAEMVGGVATGASKSGEGASDGEEEAEKQDNAQRAAEEAALEQFETELGKEIEYLIEPQAKKTEYESKGAGATVRSAAPPAKRKVPEASEPTNDDVMSDAQKKVFMSRKERKVFESLRKAEDAKAAKADKLRQKKQALTK